MHIKSLHIIIIIITCYGGDGTRDVHFREKNFSMRELFFPGSRRDLERAVRLCCDTWEISFN